MTEWTDEQRRAIKTTDKSLLVSAAAGSGKTAVLAERCAYLVCDATPRCEVDELLVVTFTKAAAAEMRARIESALRKRLELSDDPRLHRQLLVIDRAQISTLHGFCTSVLRRHFNVLGLDPNFRVLDEEEVQLLRHEIARELLDDRYESDVQGDFQRFVDVYASGNDDAVLWQVLRLQGLMCSVVDRDEWLRRATSRIAEAADAKQLTASELGARLAKNIVQWIGDVRARWIRIATQLSPLDGADAYAEHVNELLAMVDSWRGAFGEGNFDALGAELKNFELPRLPTVHGAPPIKEAIQALKKEMKDNSMLGVCRFTSAQWKDGLKRIQPAVGVLVGLVQEFDKRFAQAKRELRGVDFSDLERFTLQILREPAVAEAYRREFRHVLVDEFQDVNAVQDAILDRVCGQTNQFCVGDVKQSIYRFRLADPQRFLNRYREWKGRDGRRASPPPNKQSKKSPPAFEPTLFPCEREPVGQVIDLSANFRSRAPLLDVVNGVFERLMGEDAVEIEYDDSHRLKPGASYPVASGAKCFQGAPVELHLIPPETSDDAESEEGQLEFDRTEREAAFVAHRINQLISSKIQIAEKSRDGALFLRAIQYHDIVILLRSMQYKSQQYAQILRAAGVPVHAASGTGFFESMEIRDMLALLHVLDNQQQDVPLAAVLRSPLSGLAEQEDCLARIRLAYPNADQVPFHQAVVRYARDHDDELAAHLKSFLRELREWRRLAHQRPLAELIWQIYDSTGYLAFCAGMEDGQQRVANLIDFHERARQFGTFQRQGLGRFMQFLNSLAEQSDLGQPSIASEADDVVRVMSIHRSKGLEFPVVIVPDLGKKHNLQDAGGSILVDRDAGIGLMVADDAKRVRYPSLAHVLVQDRIRRQTLAEEMRVLYVAMTRAREHLILVGASDEKALQKWRDEWASHLGRLPPERVLSGRTMLDWLGPAAVAMDGAGMKHRIEITSHGAQEVEQWAVRAERRAALSDEQLRLARLEPLEPAPSTNLEAERIRDRLTTGYKYEQFTTLPASESVGGLTKTGRLAPAGSGAPRESTVPFDAELPSPRCVQAAFKASPTDIGSATHLVLEHLDFTGPCDADELRKQTSNLVAKKLLSPELAAAVDLDSILWLMSTKIGELLRRNAQSLRRELPVYFPIPVVGSNDPMDRMMLRGRVDVLIPDQEGYVIVDFKTDQVTAETLDARAEFYRPQINQYRLALGSILGEPIKSAALVFLRARVIRQM